MANHFARRMSAAGRIVLQGRRTTGGAAVSMWTTKSAMIGRQGTKLGTVRHYGQYCGARCPRNTDVATAGPGQFTASSATNGSLYSAAGSSRTGEFPALPSGCGDDRPATGDVRRCIAESMNRLGSSGRRAFTALLVCRTGSQTGGRRQSPAENLRCRRMRGFLRHSNSSPLPCRHLPVPAD